MLVAFRRDPSLSLVETLLETAAADVHGRRWNSGTLSADQHLEYRVG